MEIRHTVHGRHVAVLTIDNEPKRNAMSRAMMADLAALWDRLDADTVCRAVVLTGAGDKGFCAGADIGGDLSASAETARTVNRALLKDVAFTKPIVAAVNGDCAGGGVELLLSTDIRGADPAARFGLPEVRYAIYPFGGATVKLIRQIGHVHAMDLLLTGRLVEAAFAEKIGLVNLVVEPGKVLDWAIGVAETIARNSPAAVQAVKQQIATGIADHVRARESLEQQLGDRVRASADFAEGVSAFREKRRPHYP
ncbi:MAG: enoyl-CoA hydratase/isomerase family protein [Alphaproteobacteria bacterium]|nr:enoyl-CoA hydratase/isomerase family protein [Alphaproteobacteria bacterium]MBV9552850.1 enoyl-CoA hydratase/isomerase family protein [Alphaproteobacteria bacterium]